MGRHRINLTIDDPELDKIAKIFLRQKTLSRRRSVFECFLSCIVETLWKKLGEDFVPFMLCKAYEQAMKSSFKCSFDEDTLLGVNEYKKQLHDKERQVMNSETNYKHEELFSSPVEKTTSSEELFEKPQKLETEGGDNKEELLEDEISLEELML